MRFFLGWPSVTDGATVTSAGSTNPQYLTNWFPSERLVTAAGTSTEILVDLAEASDVDYVVLYGLEIPPDSSSPTWRAQVYDGAGGTGTELLDSGTLSAVLSFPSSPHLNVTSDPDQLIHVWSTKVAGGHKVTAGTTGALSIKLTLGTSSSQTWSLGYLLAGPASSLSTSLRVGGSFSHASRPSSRSKSTTGGGVSDSRSTVASAYPLDVPQMDEQDAETLTGLFEQVDTSAPFFLYPTDSPQSRRYEAGVVRFSAPPAVTRKGPVPGPAEAWKMTSKITAWR